jgi:hypothetical protein
MRAKIRAAACLSREAEGLVLELHPPHPITRAHLGRGSSASGTALSTAPPDRQTSSINPLLLSSPRLHSRIACPSQYSILIHLSIIISVPLQY